MGYRTPSKQLRAVGLREGFRSGLEESVAAQLQASEIDIHFEDTVIGYEKPARTAKYRPDFRLPNGIIIETKGRFTAEDRQKHILIRNQYPELDIRFVFSNSNQKISKKSKTSYANWCEHKGFLYADKKIPEEWIRE